LPYNAGFVKRNLIFLSAQPADRGLRETLKLPDIINSYDKNQLISILRRNLKEKTKSAAISQNQEVVV
jgi:hypothetical protein